MLNSQVQCSTHWLLARLVNCKSNVIHDVHAINKSKNHWIKNKRKKGIFNLIKMEWENSWLADKQEKCDFMAIGVLLQAATRLSVIKHVDETNYGQTMPKTYSWLHLIDFIVYLSFNWNEIIRWLHQWSPLRRNLF